MRRESSAFTLIELLVVVGIIIVLVALLVAAVGAAKTAAKKTAVQSLLSSIRTGLTQYYSDFQVYPPSSNPPSAPYTLIGGGQTGRGSAMLAQGLMGYLPGTLDGAGPDTSNAAYAADPHFGFRTRNVLFGGVPQGKICGPYAPDDPKSYKINEDTVTNRDQVFIDAYGNEVLYYRASGNVNATTPAPTVIFAPTATLNTALFNSEDNRWIYSPAYGAAFTRPDPSAGDPKFFNMLGRPSNILSTGGSPVMGADSFLLISAGPDGVYFSGDEVVMTNH